MKKNKPSSTAFLVARGLGTLALSPFGKTLRVDPLLDSIFGSSLELLAGLDILPKSVFGRRLFQIRMDVMERVSIPGIYLHYLLRKAWIEKRIRAEIEGGVSRVLIFGAGMDGLSLRLKRDFPRLEVEEWDHPATQALKKEWVLAKHAGLGVRFREIDLTSPGFEAKAIIRQRLSENGRTLVLCEGVLMYLSPGQVRDFFGMFPVQKLPGPVFFFTTMKERTAMNYQFQNVSPLVDLWLRWKGEVFKSGLRSFESAADFCRKHGLRLSAAVGSEEFRKEFLAGHCNTRPTLAEGEIVIEARGGSCEHD